MRQILVGLFFLGIFQTCATSSACAADANGWLARTEEIVRSIPDGKRDEALYILMSGYEQMGVETKAIELSQLIKDEDFRNQVLIDIKAWRYGREADLEGSLKLIESLNDSDRETARTVLVSNFYKKHLFQEAKTLAEHLSKPEYSYMKEKLIEALANSGRYDEADALLQKYSATWDLDDSDVQESISSLKETISKARSQNRKDSLALPPKHVLERSANMDLFFPPPAIPGDSFEAVKERVEKIEDDNVRLLAWRGCAGRFLRLEKQQDGLRAIEKGLEVARQTEDNFLKNQNLIILAYYLLNMDKKEEANEILTELLEKCKGEEESEEELDEFQQCMDLLNSFVGEISVGPYLINSLIRVDKPLPAIEYTLNSSCNLNWTYLGVSLAEIDHLDIVETFLSRMDNPTQKVYLCLGVAEYLWWEEEKGKEKKD